INIEMVDVRLTKLLKKCFHNLFEQIGYWQISTHSNRLQIVTTRQPNCPPHSCRLRLSQWPGTASYINFTCVKSNFSYGSSQLSQKRVATSTWFIASMWLGIYLIRD